MIRNISWQYQAAKDTGSLAHSKWFVEISDWILPVTIRTTVSVTGKTETDRERVVRCSVTIMSDAVSPTSWSLQRPPNSPFLFKISYSFKISQQL